MLQQQVEGKVTEVLQSQFDSHHSMFSRTPQTNVTWQHNDGYAETLANIGSVFWRVELMSPGQVWSVI